jgi:hypothetical protein
VSPHLLALLLAAVPEAPDAARTAAFTREARAATAKYSTQAAAIADGYRLIGDDFPGMGEHWIHLGRLFDGVYDAERPEVLTYVKLDGSPRLLGVAYAVPLLEGEEPPEGPAGRAAWHAHTGSLDEETLVPHHHHSGHAGDGPRISMVHAWLWLPNPEGLFAADNWAIPFLRLGLEPPRDAAAAAGKALSLLTGGDVYVARVAQAAAAPVTLAEPALAEVIATAVRRVRQRVEGRSGTRLSDTELLALAGEWEALWHALEALLPADARERVRSQSMR